MRAIAASYVRQDPDTKAETVQALHAKIYINSAAEMRNADVGRYTVKLPFGEFGTTFTSLHRAKNAIRRHFRIPSRKAMRWTEEVV